MQSFNADGKTVAYPSVLRSKTQGHITHRAKVYMAENNIKGHTSILINHNNPHHIWTFQLKKKPEQAQTKKNQQTFVKNKENIILFSFIISIENLKTFTELEDLGGKTKLNAIFDNDHF